MARGKGITRWPGGGGRQIAPDDGYLVGSNADAFHSTDVAVGPQLLDSTFTNILNDFFSVHPCPYAPSQGEPRAPLERR
jgi:hypothetical protein